MSLFVVDHRAMLVFHVGDSGSRVFRCHWATCGQNSRTQENIQKWSCSAPAAPEDHRAASQHSPSSASFSLSRLLSLPPAASSPATSSTDSTNTTHATNANIHGKQPSSSPSSRLLFFVISPPSPRPLVLSSFSLFKLPSCHFFKCSFIADGLLVLVDSHQTKELLFSRLSWKIKIHFRGSCKISKCLFKQVIYQKTIILNGLLKRHQS